MTGNNWAIVYRNNLDRHQKNAQTYCRNLALADTAESMAFNEKISLSDARKRLEELIPAVKENA